MNIKNKIKITVNGKQMQVIPNFSIKSLIEILKIPLNKIAIELNKKIIDKKRISKIYLSDIEFEKTCKAPWAVQRAIDTGGKKGEATAKDECSFALELIRDYMDCKEIDGRLIQSITQYLFYFKNRLAAVAKVMGLSYEQFVRKFFKNAFDFDEKNGMLIMTSELLKDLGEFRGEMTVIPVARLIKITNYYVRRSKVDLKKIDGRKKSEKGNRWLSAEEDLFQNYLKACKVGEVLKQIPVGIINAIGTGVADDKVVYSYVNKMITYYLGEQPILNQVETFLCHDDTHRKYVIDNISKLVVKPANASGGYGILIGPKASQKEKNETIDKIKHNPREFIAQPLEILSTAPTITNSDIEPRHLDLRPFILSGKNSYVTTGGLTRVALRKGSTIVNSSQGGGSKDTLIVD